VLEGGGDYDIALFNAIAGLGWLGTAIPDAYGGSNLGYDGLCVVIEQLGYALAPVPFCSSILASEAILAAGNEQQKQSWLPAIVLGKSIGTLAFAEGHGSPGDPIPKACVTNGRLTGTKLPVDDGAVANVAVVAASDDAGGVSLYLVDLSQPGVKRSRLTSIDPSRSQTKITFDGVLADRLGPSGQGLGLLAGVLDRAAVLIAFEQIGGAQACLEMARNYALERYAFNRPIGSFQAIKHKLVDVYVATELARSNAYYGAWALASGAAELPVAAAAARVAATKAFELAAKENIQTHGGMGFTWESNCHLYYRRAKLLATTAGSAPYWKDRLIGALEARNAP
jgi:acyl-CoA dehydrogenase